MRVLFTADLHISLHKKNIPYEWSIDRYKLLFIAYNKLIANNNIDIFVLGGDIFDKKPEFDELELFLEFIRTLSVKTIIYDGNHEATKKGKTFFTFLKSAINAINPLVSVIDDVTTINGIDIVPFCKLHSTDFSKIKKSKILMTHVRGNIPPHVKAEIDLEKLKSWEIVLAGDLHNHENTQLNIIYPGSPVTTSFHRTEVRTGVVILDTETLTWEFNELKLPQLIRKRVSDLDSVQETFFNHTIYEVEGDLVQLGNVKESKLIDKKIIKRKSEATLQLKDLTIEEEIKLYMSNILKIKAEDIARILSIHMEKFNE